MRPGDAGRRVGAWAGAVELGIEGLRRSGSLAPGIPPLWRYVGGKFGVDVDDAGIGTPRAAKAGYLLLRGCRIRPGNMLDPAGHLAVQNYVAGCLVGRSPRLSGQIARSIGVNFRMVKYGCGIAEDEIDSAFDI